MTSLKYSLARSSGKGSSVGTSITGLHTRGAHVTFEFNRKDAQAEVNILIKQHTSPAAQVKVTKSRQHPCHGSLGKEVVEDICLCR